MEITHSNEQAKKNLLSKGLNYYKHVLTTKMHYMLNAFALTMLT